MGRIRTLKPEFHAHEELSALPPETHLLAAALVNYADDEGYFNANPILVKAGTNPLRTDKTKTEEQLAQLERVGYVEIRRQGLKQMGRVVTFAEHQRVSHPTASKLRESFERLPKTSGESPEVLRPEGNGIEGNGTGNREASTADAVPASPAAFTVPLLKGKKHIVTAADIAAYESAYPAVDVRAEIRRVLVWLDANEAKRSDTVAGSKKRLVKWLSKTQDEGGRQHGSAQGNQAGRVSPAKQREQDNHASFASVFVRRYGGGPGQVMAADAGDVQEPGIAGTDAGDVPVGVGADGGSLRDSGFSGRTLEGNP